MKFAIVFPRVPPAIDGIADHGALLAQGLSEAGHSVTLYCAQPGEAARSRLAPGVGLVDAFPAGRLHEVRGLLGLLRRDRPDVVILQFEQFAWGARGFNPVIASTFALLAVLLPSTTRVLFAHERWAPARSLRSSVMHLYQRLQFALLAATASRIYVPTSRWRSGVGVDRIRKLSAFSNVPLVGGSHDNQVAGPHPLRFVWFGALDGSRLSYFRVAAQAIGGVEGARMTYVGKDWRTAEANSEGLGERLAVQPTPPAIEVSRVLSASDWALCPYLDGVSDRRGSFLAPLQHGTGIITTTGPSTDGDLLADASAGLILHSDAHDTAAFGALVERVARSGAELTPDERAAQMRRYAGRYSVATCVEVLVADMSALRADARPLSGS